MLFYFNFLMCVYVILLSQQEIVSSCMNISVHFWLIAHFLVVIIRITVTYNPIFPDGGSSCTLCSCIMQISLHIMVQNNVNCEEVGLNLADIETMYES